MIKFDDLTNSNRGFVEDINVHHKNQVLLVSFGGVGKKFEFFGIISNLECDKIYIKDPSQSWYQKGIDHIINNIDKLISYLSEKVKEYKKVCFLGNSMGGYAAILFGVLLNIDHVFSFSPQTFIDKENRNYYNDSRWSEHIEKIYNYNDVIKKYFDIINILNEQYKTIISIYYSSSDKLDEIHSLRLKDKKNIFLDCRPEGGHSLVKLIRNSGELKQIIIKSITI